MDRKFIRALIFLIVLIAILALNSNWLLDLTGKLSYEAAKEDAPSNNDVATSPSAGPGKRSGSKPVFSVSNEIIEEVVVPPGDKYFEVLADGVIFYVDALENPDIFVNEGDRIRIYLRSTDGYHDFVIRELVATEKVDYGEEASAEFVADRSGIFEYYSSVGDDREKGMKGRFIVVQTS